MNCIKTNLKIKEIFSKVYVLGLSNFVEKTSNVVIKKFITVIRHANPIENNFWIISSY